MNALTVVAIANNIPGIIQYIIEPNDDSFVGIYGRFTVSQNGLSIINSVLFFYYFTMYQADRRVQNLALCFFFIICCIMGFYGGGLMALIAAILLTYVKFNLRSIIRQVLIFTLILGLASLLIYLISPVTLEYNIKILEKFIKPISEDSPRKLKIFQNYGSEYIKNPLDFLLGSGPGTFNSRSAFMVGSPSYFNTFDFIKSESQPYYFKNYAYSLWNASNVGRYDGFMNQPFSSILSLLGEYGLLSTLMIIAFIRKRFKRVTSITRSTAKMLNLFVERRMFKFCIIYVSLFILIDNYIEYPEIIGLLLIIVKLSEQEIISRVELATISNP